MNKEERTPFDYELYFSEYAHMGKGKKFSFTTFVMWLLHSDKGTEFLEKINDIKRSQYRKK